MDENFIKKNLKKLKYLTSKFYFELIEDFNLKLLIQKNYNNEK